MSRLQTISVLNPIKLNDQHIMDDTDLAGPLVFCLLFGGFLLFSGKVHFGYIYGVGVLGCLSMYLLINLMSDVSLSLAQTVSILGYCLLPMVLLSVFSMLLSLQGFIGMYLALASMAWCTASASKMFVTVLSMRDSLTLVAYPCAIIYGVFALLAVF